MEILGVSINVYSLWVSKKFAMSFEVRGRFTTPSYFLSICEFSPLSRSKSALPPSHLGIVQINLPSALGFCRR